MQSDELLRALTKLTIEVARGRPARKAGLDPDESHKPRRGGIEGSGDGSPGHSFNKE
jgi:hypothetical protein